VVIRVRPLSSREQDSIIKVVDSNTLILTDPEGLADDVLRQDRPRDRQYRFDAVLDETAGQLDVFRRSTQFLVDYVLDGFNATVFAYGATGAGKTHTMLGTDRDPGVMALTLAHLFEQIGRADDAPPSAGSSGDPDGGGGADEVVQQHHVSVSYMEIYNESIRDLLVPTEPSVPQEQAQAQTQQQQQQQQQQQHLELREDTRGGVSVAGMSVVPAASVQEVLALLRQGCRNRMQEATAANEYSSRSHAILQVSVRSRRIHKHGPSTEVLGKLSMIDLAGSERAAETSNKGIRMMEGASINRSLLALGNCINALGDPNRKDKYVNFRDSKLTRLLK
ncbi:Kinesin-like protein kif19, partial [Cladochytrium tenue]